MAAHAHDVKRRLEEGGARISPISGEAVNFEIAVFVSYADEGQRGATEQHKRPPNSARKPTLGQGRRGHGSASAQYGRSGADGRARGNSKQGRKGDEGHHAQCREAAILLE